MSNLDQICKNIKSSLSEHCINKVKDWVSWQSAFRLCSMLELQRVHHSVEQCSWPLVGCRFETSVGPQGHKNVPSKDQGLQGQQPNGRNYLKTEHHSTAYFIDTRIAWIVLFYRHQNTTHSTPIYRHQNFTNSTLFIDAKTPHHSYL